MYLKILFSIMYTFLAASFCVGDLEQCDSPFFTPGGPYDISRQTILSSLDTLVLSRDGYYSGSVGEGGGRIYVMGLCLPVRVQEFCPKCIQAVSNNLLQKCLNESSSYEYGEDSSKGTVCLVRYSEVSFFNSLAQEPVALHCAQDSIGNVTEFESIWKVFVEDMIKAASTKPYYATKVSPPMGSQRIYSLMLCIPQMSSKDCEACLRESLTTYQETCDGKLGTNIRRPSCLFKWEVFPFYHDFPDPKEPTPPNSQVPQPASSPSDILLDDKKISTGIIVAIVVSAVIFAVLLTLGLVLLKKRLSYRRLNLEFNADHITSSQSLKFDFKKLEAATNKFSVNNKVGEGGFGEVYMGKLNGTEIAVKRLSKNSGQGIKEFESEVALVAKLQHRNLVSLLGFCLEKDEQILVYEFVPNKSLDYFLFDPTKRGQLDWRRRYNIIKGIIRGILYLHQDSRLKIIHRDLKASNILLDADMIPKIADFGTARIFGGQQTRAIASKIAGTLGYMAPEYAMEGQFSMKSDVYSFGVLLLEILSGKMNTSGLQTEGSTGNLVKDAWRLWRNNSGLELVDPTFGEDYQSDEVIRCIHIALLCVQQDPQDRPTMSTIISQLTSTSINLEVPRAPGIFQSNRDRDSEAEGSNSFGKPVPCSNTQLDPR